MRRDAPTLMYVESRMIQVRRYVAELVDHRHDDASVVVAQELVEPGDAAGVLQVAQAERGEVLEHFVGCLARDAQSTRRLRNCDAVSNHQINQMMSL